MPSLLGFSISLLTRRHSNGNAWLRLIYHVKNTGALVPSYESVAGCQCMKHILGNEDAVVQPFGVSYGISMFTLWNGAQILNIVYTWILFLE